MKVYSRRLSVRTSRSQQLINVSRDVERVVKESGIRNGFAVVFSHHTTMAIYINEDEGGLKSDVLSIMEKLVPRGAGYRHDEVDDNAHAHIRSILLNPSIIVPIVNGSLATGTWQSIFLAEFDGPRERSYTVQVMGE